MGLVKSILRDTEPLIKPSPDRSAERLSPRHTRSDVAARVAEYLWLRNHIEAKYKVNHHCKLQNGVGPASEFGCVHWRRAVELQKQDFVGPVHAREDQCARQVEEGHCRAVHKDDEAGGNDLAVPRLQLHLGPCVDVFILGLEQLDSPAGVESKLSVPAALTFSDAPPDQVCQRHNRIEKASEADGGPDRDIPVSYEVVVRPIENGKVRRQRNYLGPVSVHQQQHDRC